jgi:hypothetical protein
MNILQKLIELYKAVACSPGKFYKGKTLVKSDDHISASAILPHAQNSLILSAHELYQFHEANYLHYYYRELKKDWRNSTEEKIIKSNLTLHYKAAVELMPLHEILNACFEDGKIHITTSP